MKKFGEFICQRKYLIVILTLVLIIPAILGYVKTDINYDILVYLPNDIETLKGEEILTEDFDMGAFAIVITDNMEAKDIISLEDKFRKIDSVTNVISVSDFAGINIPIEILPANIISKFANSKSELILVTFKNSTSDDLTLAAVSKMREITESGTKIGGMSAMVLDTKYLFNSEMLLYILIAVILCIIVLELSLDSYIVPFILMLNIGIAILFNMGTNIFLGNISYITKAIAAVLQLGVTTDFSIFLYHKYEKLKGEYNDNNKAMSEAIHDTFISVFGSSLTTVAGFLALCTMKLTLGMDIGLVMAKGVVIGVICVLTLFPALLLVFDNIIFKTRHKVLLPKFNFITNFVCKHYFIIFIIFLVLLIPSFIAQKNTKVYYKLDESIPDNYGYSMATKTLKEDFNMVSQEMLLVNKDMTNYQINEMIKEIEKLDGIKTIISPTKITNLGIPYEFIPEKIKNKIESNNYKMIIISSNYDIATNELNDQIEKVNKIIKKYDKKNILAGEGPLMRDLVKISDQDFKSVNYTSIIVIFIIMILVLKSIPLSILLVIGIEFAIFINMGIPFITGTELPFIASVVIGTIQLGATIDYAILLTTKYLEIRKSNHDKVLAMSDALSSSISSIFVSAMCFFGATFGVGIISKIDMISSLCTLMSRGAIISMLVVIMVVPSLLLIFDKFIIKEKSKKKGDNMKKKFVLASLILAICLYPITSFALEKEETVYSKLNYDGSVKSTIVTEHLINKEKENSLSDLTDLENITNINSNSKFNLKNNSITWQANGKDVFFQGITQKKLPITISIKYYLDGKETSLKDLIGKKGHIDINFDYQNILSNTVNINGQDQTLYTPFLIATVTNISSKYNSNVVVTNGKVIDNGLGYMAICLSTPGLYESLEISELEKLNHVTISFDTTKFETSSIYMVATPKIFDLTDLNIFDKLDQVYGKIDTLQVTMNQIQSGSEKLLTNLEILSDGNNQVAFNLNLVLDNLEKINNGSIELDEGLNQILANLNQTLASFGNMDEKIASINTLIEKNNQTINILSNIKNIYNDNNLANMTILDIQNISDEYVSVEQKQQLITAKTLTESLNLNSEESIISLLTANNYALNQSIEAFNSINDAITKLTTYLPQLENGAKELSDGLTNLKNGVAILNEKVGLLANGSSELKNGMSTLNNGIVSFNNQGINTLTNYSYDANMLTSKIKNLSSLSQNYQSFSIKGDNTISNTKFILVVD